MPSRPEEEPTPHGAKGIAAKPLDGDVLTRKGNTHTGEGMATTPWTPWNQGRRGRVSRSLDLSL